MLFLSRVVFTKQQFRSFVQKRQSNSKDPVEIRKYENSSDVSRGNEEVVIDRNSYPFVVETDGVCLSISKNRSKSLSKRNALLLSSIPNIIFPYVNTFSMNQRLEILNRTAIISIHHQVLYFILLYYRMTLLLRIRE